MRWSSNTIWLRLGFSQQMMEASKRRTRSGVYSCFLAKCYRPVLIILFILSYAGGSEKSRCHLRPKPSISSNPGTSPILPAQCLSFPLDASLRCRNAEIFEAFTKGMVSDDEVYTESGLGLATMSWKVRVRDNAVHFTWYRNVLKIT